MAIQETEEVNLTPESQQHSRRNTSNLNSVSQQNPNLSLHSAKRRHDMNESDSNYGQTKRFLTMYLRILPIIFKLV